MDLWNVSEADQKAVALAKFACIGVTRVSLESRMSGLYRAVRCWTNDGRSFVEMLYVCDLYTFSSVLK